MRHWFAGKRLLVFDQQVDDAVAQPAQLIRRQLEAGSGDGIGHGEA
jgi:hypothetical protein